jgi:hypothetical protein
LNHHKLGLAALLCAAAGAIAPATASAAVGASRVSAGYVSGTLVGVESDNFTIQTRGRQTGVINALVDAANGLTSRDYPYVWGGGHSEAGVASIGERGGPGADGHTLGYDCSGAVAAVLAQAGLWRPGGSVPNDAGVIGQLLAEGLIAPGPGRPPDEVTLYDHPGVHIFMNIDGHFFGTSDGGAGANTKGGAGWLDDKASDASSRAFRQYHFTASVLHDRTTYGHEYTFQTVAVPFLVAGFSIGERVDVGYLARGGGMSARMLEWIGQQTLTGTVSSLGMDGSALILQTPSGRTVSFGVSNVVSLTGTLGVGATVQVVWTGSSQVPLARRIAVTALPAAASVVGSIKSIAPDLSQFAIETASGTLLTLSTGGDTWLLNDLAVGDPVTVDYVRAASGAQTATAVTQVEPPTPPPSPSPPSSPPPAPGQR